MGRFDYIAYDEQTAKDQAYAKARMQELEKFIDLIGHGPQTNRLAEYKAVAIMKLEEVYMYIGKALRDSQIIRNGSAELQEQRNNE